MYMLYGSTRGDGNIVFYLNTFYLTKLILDLF